MTKEKGTALRYNEGKVPLDLVTPFATEELAKVLAIGAKKYGRYNWQKGMPWSKVLASLKRHLNAFEQGKDIDEETQALGTPTYHMAHIMCNAMFLTEYYKTFSQGDDRYHRYLDAPKIALDLDGVLADFGGSYKKELVKAGIEIRDCQVHWDFSYKDKEVWDKVVKSKDFWLNLEPLCDSHLPFEPVAYISSRQIPIEWSQGWLEKNGFPCKPVYHVGKESKAEAIKATGADLFVDDNLDNFIELNKAGICTYLFDAPYNRKLNVGYKRITDLAELV